MPHECGVFVRSMDQLDHAQAAAKDAGVAFKVLDENVETTNGYISIGTMHLAEGLEFRAVAVMACDDEIIPLQERIETVGDDADQQEVYDTERHLLYVACTRARDHLLVTGVHPVWRSSLRTIKVGLRMNEVDRDWGCKRPGLTDFCRTSAPRPSNLSTPPPVGGNGPIRRKCAKIAGLQPRWPFCVDYLREHLIRHGYQKREWLCFPDAISLVEKTVPELRSKVPLERLIEECSKEYRSDLARIDLGFLIPVALLSAACASGKVRARSWYAPRKYEPIPPEYWNSLDLKFWWMDVGEDEEINVADLRQWFTDRFLRPRRRGRKPKVDWDGNVRRRLFELLDHHGLPDISDPKWSTQADVESAVLDICGVPLSESTVREHTSRLISEWLRMKAGN